MLTKIAVFNSEKYAKVIVKLDDSSSIQACGANGVGKTSLIGILNFLYVVADSKMIFPTGKEGNFYDYKKSVHYYFPTHNQSYIIFECFKANAGGYFCILVKRKNSEDDVEYFKIEGKFNESDYIDAENNLKKFNNILNDFALHNPIQPLKDKKDFFQWVYNKDTKRNAFLWINKNVNRKGQSLENSLTKTYRLLLNANSIDDNALREALIIADNRQGLSLDVFSDKSKIETVEKLKKESAYINKLITLKKEFEDFKALVGSTKIKKNLVEKLLYNFNELLKKEVENLKLQIEQSQEQVSLYQKQENIIKPIQTQLAKEIGGLNKTIENLNENKISPREKEIKEINKILQQTSPLHITVETLTEFLEDQQNSFQKQFDEIAYALQFIKQYDFTEKQILKKILDIKRDEEQIANKIATYKDLLIHNISDNKEIREKLNAFFSQEVIAKFTKDNIIQKIHSFEDILTINEGKIKGLDEIKAKPLESIEQLNESLETLEKDLKQQNDILETIKNRTEKEVLKIELENKINDIKNKITKISTKYNIENELKKLTIELEEDKKQFLEKEKKHADISVEIAKISNLVREHENKMVGFTSDIKNYQENWYPEFKDDIENLSLQKFELLENSSIEKVRQELRSEKENLNSLVSQKQRKFSELQKATENYAAEPIFITEIGKDMLTLDDKQTSIRILLEQISNQFTVPIRTFLGEYKYFKGFINTFNRYISEFTISSYTNLSININENSSLNKDLEKMAKIISVEELQANNVDMFRVLNTNEQKEYLKILEMYIENKTKIDFKSLFDISLSAKENSQTVKINLKTGEGASTGTYKMIILILFLSVIDYFKSDENDNKLVFPIDEDTISDDNLDTLLSFCKEKGFICIFAAKKQIVGIEKFYFFKQFIKVESKDKLIVTENHSKLVKKKKL